MSRAGTRAGRSAAIGTAIAGMLALIGGGLSPAKADHQTVTAVLGSSFGFYANVGLFDGPASPRGPAPTVTLPASGSATPITASAPTGDATYGPAKVFTSGPITVSTQGTTGVAGSVTTTANVQNVNTSGEEVLTATNVSSTCTASSTGASGSTTITGGVLQTSEGNPDVEGDETNVVLPTNPAPNTTYNGVIEGVGDSFRYVFNEQIVGADGRLTVNAGHLYLLGPTAIGDLIVGQVVCDVTLSPASHVNASPVANDDTYFTGVGIPLTVGAPGVLGNDTDANGDLLAAGSASDPAGGTVTLNADGSFTYTPDAGFTATDTFTYTATDPSGASDTATVTITQGNRAPVANDDSFSTLVNTPLTVPAPGVLANDLTDRGDDLTAGSASDPAGGSVTLNPDGSFIYTPDTGFAGADTFTYTATDEAGATDTATVTVTVSATPGNISPVAVTDSYSTIRNVPLVVAAPGVLANDTDADGDTLTVLSAAPAPGSGSVTMNADGSFTFTPTAGMVGVTYIRYIVSDGRGGTAEGRVLVFVDPDPRECDGQLPTITGTDAGDTLVGTSGRDIVSGLGGNDTIVGLGGDDLICGGAGNDNINGGADHDAIEGGDGDDRLVGGDGDDFIQGFAGDDQIDGGRGSDFLLGGDGNDGLVGGNGFDFLLGDSGDDRLDGGADDDTIFGGDGNDSIDGGMGNDFLLGEFGDDLIVGGMGDDIVGGDDGVDVCDPVTDRRPSGTNSYSGCEAGAGAAAP